MDLRSKMDIRSKKPLASKGDVEMANLGPASQLLSIGKNGESRIGAPSSEFAVDPRHGVHGNYNLPLYAHMPVPLLRLEIGKGRVRWCGDGFSHIHRDFWFYLRCNHEGIALFLAPPATGTNRFVRLVLLFYSLCFGLGFNCAMTKYAMPAAAAQVGDSTGDDDAPLLTSEQSLAMTQSLGVFLFVLNKLLEVLFTCPCIRGCMDAKEEKSIEEKGDVRAGGGKCCENVCFRLCQCFSGMCATCIFLPLGAGSFCLAVWSMSNDWDISYSEAAKESAKQWIFGWLSGLGYSLVIGFFMFFFKYVCCEKTFKQPGQDVYERKQKTNDVLERANDQPLSGPLDMKTVVQERKSSSQDKDKDKEGKEGAEKRVPYFA